MNNLNDDSNTDHEIEALLHRLTPRSAPHDLRREVLQSVENQLASPQPVKQGGVKRDEEKRGWARWDFLSASAAAALLAAAACFNVWTCARQEQRLSQLYGPTPTPQAVADISEAIEAVAGAEASRSLRGRLLAMRRRRVSFVSHNEKIRQLLDELRLSQKGRSHVEAQKDFQMDRDSRRGSDRDTSERTRSIELESRFTA